MWQWKINYAHFPSFRAKCFAITNKQSTTLLYRRLFIMSTNLDEIYCAIKSCILELNLHLNCANSTTLNCTVWHEYTMRRWVDKKASKKEKFMIPWRSEKAVKQDVFLPQASHFCSTKYQHCIKRSERQLQFRLVFFFTTTSLMIEVYQQKINILALLLQMSLRQMPPNFFLKIWIEFPPFQNNIL